MSPFDSLKNRLVVVVFLATGIAIYGVFKMEKRQNPIRVGSGGVWVSLHPGLQHTVYADMVLSNQFDALVGVGEDGQLIPLGAKSWKISPDFRDFEFEIDTTKKFSDGTQLTSYDYKRSWEEALSLTPRSENNSLLDILYKVKGFENFDDTKNLSGLATPTKDVFQIHFKTPFRMAIDHLQGNRFSAYKQVGENVFIGTGCYVISEKTKNRLSLVPNPHSQGCKSNQQIELSFVSPKDAAAELMNGNLDVFAFGFSTQFNSMPGGENIRVVSGYEAGHEVAYLNGIQGKLFENPHFRLAMQYLLLKSFKESDFAIKNPTLLKEGSQIYLPFQPGQLDEAIVERIVTEGQKYVSELVEATRRRPLLIYTIEIRSWVMELVRRTGISVSERSRVLSREEFLIEMYKTNESDLLAGGFSLSGNDPDNIYHLLGKSGAIASKMTYRKEVADLLERGREIIDQAQLNEHYKKVAIEVLEQVPFVHFGFAKALAIYREDKIKLKVNFIRRNFGHLDIYERK